MIPEKAVERLVGYKHLVTQLVQNNVKDVFSHELAELAGVTAAQVRRDFMDVGCSGNSRKGYDARQLAKRLEEFLMPAGTTPAILVGVGNLGRAMLAHFSGSTREFKICAAFDKDPNKANRVISGCRCYPMKNLHEVVEKQPVRLGILTVPATEAQNVCDCLVKAEIRAVVSFARLQLRTPHDMHVEHIDIAAILERAAFYAFRKKTGGTDK